MKKYIAIIVLALMAVNCDKENFKESVVEDGVMRIEVLHPSTRATVSAFESGDVIGLYATTYEGDDVLPLQISAYLAGLFSISFAKSKSLSSSSVVKSSGFNK